MNRGYKILVVLFFVSIVLPRSHCLAASGNHQNHIAPSPEIGNGDFYAELTSNPAYESFEDVSPDSWAYSYIEAINKLGITEGCGTGFYCPEEFTNRAQVAICMERAINGSSYKPSPAVGVFADVPTTFWAADWIEQFYADGLTKGCSTNPLQFCPDQNVTRADMAIFLLRKKHGSSYSPPKAKGIFADVPASFWAADWVEQLYAEGITTGCDDNPLKFCPNEPVTRAQMAVFLVRAFFAGDDPQTLPYLLQLPAGVSLISSPLDAGSGHAIEAFIGVDKQLPLLFEWDSSTQQFLNPEESMLSPGAGYWYYTPVPTTLLIFGKPYQQPWNFTKDITPGWHLIGVPFSEGIDWSSFHLYASGNPIGLETARDLGWISSDIQTMQGSSWQTHEAGTPFEPGSAYWIETKVPLSIRAEPGLAGATSPTPKPLTNITKVIDNKNNLIKTGEDILAGKLKTGALKGAGAVFSLVNMAISKYRYDNIMDEVNVMDDKVDQLLTDMGAIQNQLATIESQIEGLQDWIMSDATLGQPLRDSETWIANYFQDPALTLKTYNWALWKLAGCEVSAGTCTDPITDDNLENFNKNYYTTSNQEIPPNPPTLATDNFYLWWAYNVLGHLADGISAYEVNGNDADTLKRQLYNGMVHPAGTEKNGLQTYMEYVFNESACKNDVTACDLYAEVYLPFEAYFQQIITNQITLVQAIVESYAELASFYETKLSSTAFDDAVSDYMTGFQQMLSDEAEAFVEVAEQIALYRAADGRYDWSSFNTSDASQLLARADFLAARLVGSPTGRPWAWPPGVTGRIFYTEQQAVPSSTTVHSACLDADCIPLTEVVPMLDDSACKIDDENYPDQCVLKGNWPYLQWSSPDSSGAVSGTPTFTWKLRRLAPDQLAAGTYQVASINAQYEDAKLVVSEYGADYSNPPTEGTTSVLFGSFNNVEGNLGIGALGANRAISGGSDDHEHDFTSTQYDNYTQMKVEYLRYAHTGPGSSANWYEKIYVKVPEDDVVFGSFPRIRVFWPSTIEINLGSYRSGQCCQPYYYQKVEQSLRLLDSKGNSVVGEPFAKCPTGSDGFSSCNYSTQDRNDTSGVMLASLPPVALNHSMTYTLQARFSDDVDIYCGSPYCYCQMYPNSGSHVTWNVFNPTITLTK
ncbi:MAG: S-layer homology domain-containing protein [Desulfoferrobacter sp.]